MSVRTAKIRWTVLAGLVGLLAAGRAYAQATTCQTDMDCPNPACGGDVCVMSSGGAQCFAANTVGSSDMGNDGWCAVGGVADDTKCKCHALGATCDGFSCKFTVPPDGGATGTGGTGGSGTGGSGTGGSGTGGSGTGGAAAGTSGGGGGGGGCSVAGAPSVLGSAGAALLLAAALGRRRVRRRA